MPPLLPFRLFLLLTINICLAWLVLPAVAFYNIPGGDTPTMPWNLVRLYIGLEDPQWLIEGLERALAQV